MPDSKIRIGLLINEENITAWNYAILQEIINFPFVEITLIVTRTKTNKSKNIFQRVYYNRKTLAWLLYQKLDEKLFKVTPNAFKTKNITALLPDTPIISVKPKETKFSDRFHKRDLSTIKDYNVDLFIRFGFRILRGKILSIAKYGIWSYHHGNSYINRGGPAGFWELAEKWESTGATLQRLTEDLDGGLILGQTNSSTDHLSLRRNKNAYYWSAVTLLPKQLKELNRLGPKKYFDQKAAENSAPIFYSNRIFKKPNNFNILLLLIGLFFNKCKDKIWRLYNFEQWILLYHFTKGQNISKSFFRYKKILPPKDRFWADPFVVEEDSKYYLFIEELEYKKGKGHISVMQLDSNGNYTFPVTVIEEDYHLSYPFIFKVEQDYYLIPESKQNKTIDLYKCESFPFKWKKIKTLIENIIAVDTTLHYQNGIWWMFVSVTKHDGASSNDFLHLYYSESFDSTDWVSHPMNPIVSDSRNARPAGNIFKFNNHYFRPSQNCGKRYGHGLNINRIDILTTDDYKETCMQHVLPNWDKSIVGTHTLNQTKNLTVSDASRKTSKFNFFKN